MEAFSFISIIVLLATAFLAPLVSFKKEKLVPYLAMAGTFIALVLAILTIPQVISQGVVHHQMEFWGPPFGITIAVDSLSLLLIILITSVGFLVTLFSYRFIEKGKTKYYTLLCLFLVGLLGIVHTGDIFNMFVFFEIMGLSSYLLVSYYRNAPAIEGSLKYLIMGSFGTSLVLMGVVFLYGMTGTLNMADLAVRISVMASPVLPLALGLLLAGFGIKAAIFPFHAWKPDAVSVAPAPVGAVLSAVGGAVGIYAIFRIMLTVFAVSSVYIYLMIAVLGAVTMVVGAVLALQQSNLLRLLAYSSISQVGYVLVAFGLGMTNSLGYTAAVFHLLNVVLFEALLFLCAGVIIYKKGTLHMGKLGGLANMSPALTWCFVIGMLSAVGLPLFNGFASKWLIYVVTLATYPILTVLTVLVSVLTLAYFLKAYSLIFLGNPGSGASPAPGIPKTMLMPLLVLAALCILLGVLPWIGMQVSGSVAQSFNNTQYISSILGGV